MFRKSFIDNYNLKFMNTFHSNDIAFVFLAMAYAEKIVCVNDVLINYIKHPQAISCCRDADNFCDVEVYKCIINELKKLNLFKYLEKAIYKVMLQSYYDALFLMCKTTKYDFVAIVKKIKKLLPYEALYYNKNEAIGRKFIFIKIMPSIVSYYYFRLKNKLYK